MSSRCDRTSALVPPLAHDAGLHTHSEVRIHIKEVEVGIDAHLLEFRSMLISFRYDFTKMTVAARYFLPRNELR